MLETKFQSFDQAGTQTIGNQISGYASLFGLADQGGDIVSPGAYAVSLTALRDSGRSVKMLWQHDPNQPIGVWDEVREDAHGLYVKGRVLTDLKLGQEVMTLVSAGAIDGLSIGYRTVKADKSGEGRVLKSLDLWEVSLVTFPMLPQARVTQNQSDDEAQAFSLLHDAARAAATEF
ncbi:MAG: HK97 family phage prohead protease [Pseudomonadota bacterium]